MPYLGTQVFIQVSRYCEKMSFLDFFLFVVPVPSRSQVLYRESFQCKVVA